MITEERRVSTQWNVSLPCEQGSLWSEFTLGSAIFGVDLGPGVIPRTPVTTQIFYENSNKEEENPRTRQISFIFVTQMCPTGIFSLQEIHRPLHISLRWH